MTLSPALLLALPLASAAILTAFLDRIPRRLTEWLSIAIAAVTWAGTIALLVSVYRGGTIVQWIGGWHPGNRVGLGIVLGVDLASACVAVLVAGVVLAAVVFSYQYFEDVGTIFYVLILAILGAMIAFAYAGDLFNMFVWYEVFSVAAYALSTYHGETTSAYRGALQFAITNTVAGLFFLIGITLLEGRTGELDFVAIGHSLAKHHPSDVLVTTSLAFISIGLFTRGALAPMQFWFDEVHATAPAPLSAILSGAMAPLALYGFVRIYWMIYAGVVPPSHLLTAAFAGVGALTALYGTSMTLRESRLKRKLAQSTVAHAGVALAAIGAFTLRGLTGAAIYAGSYACAAATLFFAIAVLKWAAAEHDIKLLRGAGRNLPLTATAFALGTLVPAGVWNGMRAIADAGSPGASGLVATLAIVVAAGTGGGFLAAFVRIFTFEPRTAFVRSQSAGVPWFLIGPAIALGIAATAIAVAPIGLALAQRSAAGIVARNAYADAIMDGTRLTVTGGLTPHPALWSLLGPLGACVVAAGILVRFRPVRAMRIIVADSALYRIFHAIDAGDTGAYIAWIAGSGIALAGLLSYASAR